MRDHSISPRPSRSGTSTSTRQPRFRSSQSFSEALKNLGGDGSLGTDILKGPVADGFPDPRSRWNGVGAETPLAPSAQQGSQHGPPTTRPVQRVKRKPVPYGGISVPTSKVASQDRNGGTETDGDGPGLLGLSQQTTHHHHHHDTDEGLDRLVQPRMETEHRSHLKPQRNTLPPYSDGVPAQGLFSKTKGHYQYTPQVSTRMLPVEKLPDQYSKMSDKDANIEHAEGSNGKAATPAPSGSSAPPLTKGQKVKAHLKKWWWLHLLILVCIVILSVCLIIFVAVPKIAQARVDAAKLSIQGIQMTQTQSTNFTLAINSTIEADDSIHAVIDPFEGVMYLEDWAPQTPFARIQFPQTTSAPLTAVNITQFTEILDLNAFTVFNSWFLVNETINVSVEGNTQLTVSGISRKYPVHFKKTVALTALSNLNGTTVPTSRVQLTPDADGNNFFGTVVIPNRSLISFEIGNSSFINYMLDQNVGVVYIDNLSLHPGNNTFPLRGNVSQTPVLQAIQEPPYCQTGNLPFLLQGLNVSNHGEYLSYYAESLASTNQSVSIDVLTDLEALGLTINCINSTTKRDASEMVDKKGTIATGWEA